MDIAVSVDDEVRMANWIVALEESKLTKEDKLEIRPSLTDAIDGGATLTNQLTKK